MTLVLVCGLFYPEVSTGLGALYFVARLLYTYFYQINPNRRAVGALLGNISQIVLLGFSISGIVKGLLGHYA